MEKQLVPNNTTLPSLRGLLRAARKKVTAKEGVYIDLRLWDYGEEVKIGRIAEDIGVYRSGTGEGTSRFRILKEAQAHIDSWKEEPDGENNSSV